MLSPHIKIFISVKYLAVYNFSPDDLLCQSDATHQALDFREMSGGGTGPGRGGGGGGIPPVRTCPSMPVTPDTDLRITPPRSQSQPSDLTQVIFFLIYIINNLSFIVF